MRVRKTKYVCKLIVFETYQVHNLPISQPQSKYYDFSFPFVIVQLIIRRYLIQL